MELKTAEEIEIMAEGGRRLGAVLRDLQEQAQAGVSTLELDRIAGSLIKGSGALPAFLRYRPAGAKHAYPYTLCASVNSVVVHGQPSTYVLRDGDIIKLDLGLKYKGFYLDSAVTVAVGTVSREAKKLIEATKEAMYAAIKQAKAGNSFGDIGYAVERIVTKHKFSVVEGLTGHGIGRELHEEPPVFNVGQKGKGGPLEAGMVLAIEPMVAVGRGEIQQLLDESYGTENHTLAAHFEHTVAITEHGPRILTE